MAAMSLYLFFQFSYYLKYTGIFFVTLILLIPQLEEGFRVFLSHV